MTLHIRECTKEELAEVRAILLLAEPSSEALNWSLTHMSDAVYRLDVDGDVAGAATLRWRDPCEIIELAISEAYQGKSLGKELLEWIVGESRRRGMTRVLVGTASSSLGNIRFYQRCGFRVESVR